MTPSRSLSSVFSGVGLPRRREIVRAIGMPALLLVLVACGSAPDTSADEPSKAMVLDPALACQSITPSAAQVAVLDYISTADPKPLRFLNAVSTDSALPDDVALVVQDKGPTFYWLQDAKNQQQIRDKLANDGSWATMLVVVRENTDHGDGTYTMRIGGRYVGAANDGAESPEKRYNLRCQVDSTPASWVMDTNAGSGGS